MPRKGYKPIYMEIPEDLWKEFAIVCLNKGKSRTQVIIGLIEKFVKS